MTSYRDSIDPGWRERLLPRHPSEFVFQRNNNLDETLPIVDQLLSPQTIVHFLEFCWQGVLPTGEKTSFNLMDDDVIANYVFDPYAEWSPGPHDQLSPLQHVQIRIGSHEDSGRLTIVEKRVHAMKSRLWEGIVPISDTRWRQKDLDAVENHQLACLYIAQVVEVFHYLQTTEIQDALTQTYTLIRGHLRDFDRAVNKLPKREGQPTVQLAAMWEEFMTAYYTVMTTRAHNWATSKTNHLRDLEERRLAALHPATEEYDSETLAITNRIHDLSTLALKADGTIFIGMPNADPPLSNIIPPLGERAQQWQTDLKIRTRQLLLKETLESLSLNRTPDAFGSPAGALRTSRVQRKANDELRVKWRGDPISLPPPGWITKLKFSLAQEQPPSQWGFNVYRLSYKASDAEWAEFLRKLEADLNNWGEGEPGAEEIKPLSKLTWLDGRELGIAEDDIAAARKHYAEIGKESNPGFGDAVFWVIDTPSYDSYAYASPFADVLLPGDTGGFVTAVDTQWDPTLPDDPPDERAAESPNYPGILRVLGNLVYPELFAMMVAQAQYPDDLWPLAMNHPEFVYAGTTVKPQVELWKGVSRFKLSLLNTVAKQVCAATEAPNQS